MNWIKTEEVLPKEGVPVNTISEGGQEAVLVRQGRLWFFEDFSMYVYYTPKFWREKNA